MRAKFFCGNNSVVNKKIFIFASDVSTKITLYVLQGIECSLILSCYVCFGSSCYHLDHCAKLL
jgi:hypothetical protein